MSWDEVGQAARALAEAVHASGYQPGIILAVARGGLIPAAAVAYALGVKNTYTMNVEFYTDVDQRLDVPMVLPPVPDLVDVADADLLIVDDVADT
ncbi:MAG: phosphoribosyltransferase, partial [Thermoleophilia bacterium]|nr:phosphoribosyltransferase [Thermoleophilia bacterium]